MIDRTVRGETVYITGTTCEIQITTLSRGKIFLKLQGNDCGELGRIPFEDLNHKLDPRNKTEIFIDTSAATGVSTSVTDQWEKWFATNRSKLLMVHLYAPSKFFSIAAGIIKELSGSGDIFRIYSDAELFQKALGSQIAIPIKSAGTFQQIPKEDPKFEGAFAQFRFVRLRPGVLFIKISGHDIGERVDEVLTALSEEIKAFPGPLELFIDASETRGVSAPVSDRWTKWIAENSSKLLSIDVLSGSRLVTLVILAAKIFSRTGDLMKVMDQKSEFLTRMEAAAPGSDSLITKG